jgi:HAD superfamily hydrolase (TIGR01509 family)
VYSPRVSAHPLPESLPAAVLFDLDGTLVNSEPLNVESVVLAVRRHHRELDADDRQFIIGHSWNEIHARIALKHDLRLPMDALIAEAVVEKHALVAASGLPALPGAVETVRRLGKRARLAVVTGASRIEAYEAVDSLGVRDAFAFVLAAEDYSRGKPDPEPYRLAMSRLGVRPGDCLVLEDATPGIKAARGAGARVIGVRAGNYSGYDLSIADLVVDTLPEVTDAVIAQLFPPR